MFEGNANLPALTRRNRRILIDIMAIAIAFLRGINVGAHHRIGMAPLREVFLSLALEDPRTCLQSGNVIFRTEHRTPDRLCDQLEAALQSAFGFRPAVILRTAQELKALAAANPFSGRKDLDPSRLVIFFLPRDPGKAAREAAAALDGGPEEIKVGVREVYVYFPNGLAKAAVSMAALEKALGVAATARNWNTVTKVLQIASQMT